MIVARFNCGNCGHGPYEVEDNRDAPIPAYAIPVTVHHADGEGHPLHLCLRCETDLPQFLNKAAVVS
jgi:hypothetical protein